PLIPNNRGHRVIPFDHFINNDLEYLRGCASSRMYTTSVTKTKAVDDRHIKWIEDLFYGFAVNQKSTRDVYSKRRINAVTELKIVEWHNYNYLDWITVRRDDDKLYKFKEEEPMQTTFEMEEPSHPEFETGADDQPIVEPSQHPEWFSQQKKPPTLDRDCNKTLSATHKSIQSWISKLAKQSDCRSFFNELMDTPVDFSNFLMNQLKVDTLTP
nr:hypothetical protein [Tanacetum cinerariifolium]